MLLRFMEGFVCIFEPFTNGQCSFVWMHHTSYIHFPWRGMGAISVWDYHENSYDIRLYKSYFHIYVVPLFYDKYSCLLYGDMLGKGWSYQDHKGTVVILSSRDSVSIMTLSCKAFLVCLWWHWRKWGCWPYKGTAHAFTTTVIFDDD